MKSTPEKTSDAPRDDEALDDERLDHVVGGLQNQPFTPHSVRRLEDELDADEAPSRERRRR